MTVCRRTPVWVEATPRFRVAALGSGDRSQRGTVDQRFYTTNPATLTADLNSSPTLPISTERLNDGRLELVTDQWNTPFDDCEGVPRKTLTRGRQALGIPPAALMQEYQSANRLVEHLAEQGVYVHFETDSERVQIQMLDTDGRVIAEVSPLRLLESLTDGHDLLL